jgi:quercetin dioxygenase-like cupin family protein
MIPWRKLLRISFIVSLTGAAAPMSIDSAFSQEFHDAQQDSGKLIVHERDVKPLTVWEWEEDGASKNAFGDQPNAKIPRDAAKIELQLYNFPTGQLRKIYFTKGTRTPWHPNLDDIIFYSIDAHQVEFVGQASFYTRPGDVTIHPAGVDHHSETLVAGTRLEFAFDAQDKSGRDLIAMSGRDMMLHDITEWVEGGKRLEVIGATDRPGGKYRSKLFYFPAYTLFEQHFPRGERLPTHVNAAEKLLYVLEGRLKVTTDGVTDEVAAGSMVRLVAGKSFAREALADSTVLELAASKAPRPYPR